MRDILAKHILWLIQRLYSEGETPSGRWKWNETIGAVIDRPGREGTVFTPTMVEKNTRLK